MKPVEPSPIIRSVHIRHAGPLHDRIFTLGRVNLLLGNNEEGKTSFTDTLISQLFSSHSRHSVVKGLLSDPARRESEAHLEWTAPPPDISPFASLLVIREGRSHWAGREAHDLADPGFWNREIRSVLYENDGIFTRISRELTSLLGVSRSNTWLNRFLSNLRGFSSQLEQTVIQARELQRGREELSDWRREEAGLRRQLDALSAVREQAEWTEQAQLLSEFFRLTELSRQKETELGEWERKYSPKAREEWNTLQNEKNRLQARLQALQARMDTLQSALRQSEQEQLKLLQDQAQTEYQLQMASHQVRDCQEQLRYSREESSRPRSRVWWALAAAVLLTSGVSLSVFSSLGLLPLPPAYQPAVVWSGAGAAGLGLFLFLLRLLSHRRSASSGQDSTLEVRLSLERALVRQQDLESLRESLSQRTAALAIRLSGLETAPLQDQITRLQSREREVLQSEQDWLLQYQSYEEQVALETRLRHLRDALQNIRTDLDSREKRVAEVFGPLSRDRLHLELKQLEQRLSDEALRNPPYREQDNQSVQEKLADLQARILQKDTECTRIRSQILISVTQGIQALQEGIQNDKPRRFYPQFLEWDLKDDPWNVLGLSGEVEAFIRQVEEELQYSRVLEQASRKLDSGVDDLLQSILQDPLFLKHWEKLTGGHYSGISFSTADGLAIQVQDSAGNILPFSSLSTGTHSQFYFALRLALAARRLSGPGLMILDDAFLSYDQARRRAALEILRDYCHSGWQIFYTAVNDGYMDKLFLDIFGAELNLIRLDNGI